MCPIGMWKALDRDTVPGDDRLLWIWIRCARREAGCHRFHPNRSMSEKTAVVARADLATEVLTAISPLGPGQECRRRSEARRPTLPAQCSVPREHVRPGRLSLDYSLSQWNPTVIVPAALRWPSWPWIRVSSLQTMAPTMASVPLMSAFQRLYYRARQQIKVAVYIFVGRRLLRPFAHRCCAEVSSVRLGFCPASSLVFQSCFVRRSLLCRCWWLFASSALPAIRRPFAVANNMAEGH